MVLFVEVRKKEIYRRLYNTSGLFNFVLSGSGQYSVEWEDNEWIKNFKLTWANLKNNRKEFLGMTAGNHGITPPIWPVWEFQAGIYWVRSSFYNETAQFVKKLLQKSILNCNLNVFGMVIWYGDLVYSCISSYALMIVVNLCLLFIVLHALQIAAALIFKQ